MRFIGNVLWHIPFLGFVGAFLAFVLGTILTIAVITAPIGLGLIQYSKFLLFPYSYEMIKESELGKDTNIVWSTYSSLIQILYLPIGLIFTFVQLCQIIGLFLSIVGIPVAIPLARSLHVYINPVGKICVDRDVAELLRSKNAEAKLKRLQS